MASAQFQIKLGVNSSGVSAGVNQAIGQFKRMAGSVQGVFGAIAGSLAGGFAANEVRKAVAFGGEISDSAKKFGVGTEAFQEFLYAANQSGAEMSDLEAGFKALAKVQISAIEGSKESAELLERYGFGVEAVKKLKPEELFRSVAFELGKVPAGARATSDAIALLGNKGAGGANLLPALRNGFTEAIEEARNFGIVLTDETIQALDKVGDKISTLGKISRAVFGNIVIDVIDSFGEIGNGIATMVAKNSIEKALKKLGFDESSSSTAAAALAKQMGRSRATEAANERNKPSNVNTPEEDGVEKKQKTRRQGNSGVDRPAVDSLARIGLIRGHVTRRVAPDESVRELRRIATSTQGSIELMRQHLFEAKASKVELREIRQAMTQEVA